ncbi:MAG: hypothetical protein J7576_08460 [Siphonobacter aquaeclarae]|nr:hypothetical protein [Siphonobacter aquaeclarae]
MNVERRVNLLYTRESGHLRYSATHDEISFLENAPFSSSVFIPREFSFAERSVLLNTASGKEISQSFYDLNPNRLKKIFQPAFYDKIETQLNENYVKKVLANSPVKLEDKIEYLRQRGIVIEATTNGGYELGFMGNSNTGEMRCRMTAGDTFARMLRASGYGRQKQEASRSFLLSQRGRMAVDLAQALDTNNTNQTRFVMDQVHRLNQEYANYADSRELLEILSGRSGTVRGQSSELAREAGKIQWKNRRR